MRYEGSVILEYDFTQRTIFAEKFFQFVAGIYYHGNHCKNKCRKEEGRQILLNDKPIQNFQNLHPFDFNVRDERFPLIRT